MLGAWGLPVRLMLALGVMLVPAICMGATLPFVASGVVGQQDRQRNSLALLYGANTIGAVVGTMFANFWALGALGTRSTLWLACCFNLLAVALAWRGSRLVSDVVPKASETVQETALTASQIEVESRMATGLIWMACGVVGFVFFSMEIVWFRMLAPLLGGTIFTFGLILAIALAGIGAGSFAYTMWHVRRSPVWFALVWTCLLEAIAVAVPLWLGDSVANLAIDMQVADASFSRQVVGWMVVGGFVVFPASLWLVFSSRSCLVY